MTITRTIIRRSRLRKANILAPRATQPAITAATAVTVLLRVFMKFCEWDSDPVKVRLGEPRRALRTPIGHLPRSGSAIAESHCIETAQGASRRGLCEQQPLNPRRRMIPIGDPRRWVKHPLCQGVGAPIRSARLSAPMYCEACWCSNVVAHGARATITLVATFRNRRAKAILIYRRTDTRRTLPLGSDTPRLRVRSNSSVKETDMPIENCEKMDARGMPIQKCLAPTGRSIVEGG